MHALSLHLIALLSASLLSSSLALAKPSSSSSHTALLSARQYEEPDYSGTGCDMSDPNCNNDNGHGTDDDCSCSDPSCTSFACVPDNDQFNGLGDDLPSMTADEEPMAEPTEDPMAMPSDDPFAAMTTTADEPAMASETEAPSKPTKSKSGKAASLTTSMTAATGAATGKPTPVVVHHGAAPRNGAPLALAAIGVFALVL